MREICPSHRQPQLHIISLFVAFHIGASALLSDTIVSIKTNDSEWQDIAELPQKMTHAGFVVDEKIALFLKAVRIETLGYIETQIVKTSPSTVDSDELCGFVANASAKLSLESNCARDINGKRGRSLNVNDPDARYQKHFRRLEMGGVWRLSLPYVKRKVKVAVIDSGIDFYYDRDFSPLKAVFPKKSGGFIEGGWNFLTDTPNLTNDDRHGTHICRILAAKTNNGMAGIASNVSLVVLQTADSVTSGHLGHFLAALNMAIDLQVDVLSMSVAFNMSGAHRRAFSLMWNALHNVPGVPWDQYPCQFGGPLSMCVTVQSNSKKRKVLASGYSWGKIVDLATFGNKIYVGDYKGRSEYRSGTSYATAIVAGIAAILISMDVEPKMVKPLMIYHADPLLPKSPRRINHTIRGGALNPLNTVKGAIHYITSRA
ncbi:hypothetical protein FOL47_003825 [Perkinsus chesapeaki]|uniref:subtilisin n=1 Tax=Perkinsus chesapeaki TaxID=330153 RepID=A0A7J6M6B5_PERCH|nr:hypothetical protein FOL47_003825 [Perkinsus chesapeaki]